MGLFVANVGAGSCVGGGFLLLKYYSFHKKGYGYIAIFGRLFIFAGKE